MKRIISLLLLTLLIIGSMAGCAGSQETAQETPAETETQEETTTPEETETPEEHVESQNVMIAGLKGPTSMGMIKLFEEKALNSDTYSVEYMSESAPDALVGKIITGDVQIAAVPTNLASVLYNKTEGAVQFLALNTLGVIHIVGSADIESLEELKGQTLYVSGQGATPDYAINYILEKKGLKDDIAIEFFPDHSSLAQAVIAGDAPAAVLPQPFVTQVVMKSEDVSILVDLNQAWSEATDNAGDLTMGCLLVNKEFAENNKDFVAKFMTEYENSVNWVNENPAEAGVLIESNGILPDAKLAEMAIPNCAIVIRNAQDAKDEINAFLEVLMNFNPSSIGGKLPNEDFFYSE
jgi:NitT/TauT family transport system substrate-binding protein